MFLNIHKLQATPNTWGIIQRANSAITEVGQIDDFLSLSSRHLYFVSLHVICVPNCNQTAPKFPVKNFSPKQVKIGSNLGKVSFTIKPYTYSYVYITGAGSK